MSHTKPIKKVSARKYPRVLHVQEASHGDIASDPARSCPGDPVPAADPSAAKIRMRIKGQSDGPVYQGQKLVAPCKGCGHK